MITFLIVFKCLFFCAVECQTDTTNYRCKTYGQTLPGNFPESQDWQNFEPSGLGYYNVHPYNHSLVVVSDNGQVALLSIATGEYSYWNLTFPDDQKNFTLVDQGKIYYDTDFEGVTTIPNQEGYFWIGVEWPPTIMKFNFFSNDGNGSIESKFRLPGMNNTNFENGMEGLTYVPYDFDHGKYNKGYFYCGSQADGKIYVFSIDDEELEEVVKYDLDPYLEPYDLEAPEISGMYYYEEMLFIIIDKKDVLMIFYINEDNGELGELYAVVDLPEDDQEGIVVVPTEKTDYLTVFLSLDKSEADNPIERHEVVELLLNIKDKKFMAECKISDSDWVSVFLAIFLPLLFVLMVVTAILIVFLIVISLISYRMQIKGNKDNKNIEVRDMEDIGKLRNNTIMGKHMTDDSIRISASLLMKFINNPENSDFEIPIKDSVEVYSDKVKKVIEDLTKDEIILNKDKIEIVKAISRGSYGSVFIAKYKVGGASLDVAVKQIVLGPHVNFDDIQNEVKVMTTMKNPYILQCFGVYFDKGMAHIVMEYCDSGDLFHFKKKCTKSLKLLFLFHIAKGMDYLHKKGIAHRDLKSQNILIKGKKQIKICDFGTSKKQETIEETKTIVGTPEYIAPEILKGKYDPFKIDIYSFGIIIWEVFSEETPYQDELKEHRFNQVAMISKLKEIQENGIKPSVEKIRKKCPEDVIELMKECWETDPTDRPNSFSVIVSKLEEIIKEENKIRRKKKRQTATEYDKTSTLINAIDGTNSPNSPLSIDPNKALTFKIEKEKDAHVEVEVENSVEEFGMKTFNNVDPMNFNIESI